MARSREMAEFPQQEAASWADSRVQNVTLGKICFAGRKKGASRTDHIIVSS